jgi:hypothetical protein
MDRESFLLRALLLRCALAPVIGSSFPVRDGEDDNLFTMQLIDNGIGKFSNYEAPPLRIEPGPAQGVPRN